MKKNLFNELFTIGDVEGVLFYSPEGVPKFSRFVQPTRGDLVSDVSEAVNWYLLSDTLGEANETELIFEKKRLYIKKTKIGYLFVIMGKLVTTAMVRLSCEIIIPDLEKRKKGRGLARFFRL